MDLKVKDILLNRKNILVVKRNKGTKTNDLRGLLEAELINLGYKLKFSDSTLNINKESEISKNYIDILRNKKGYRNNYVPLFLDFPKPITKDFTYDRIVGYFAKSLVSENIEEIDTPKLEISKMIFNLKKYSADPITLKQVKTLLDEAVEKEKQLKETKKSKNVFDIITVVDEEEGEKIVKEFLYNTLSSPVSMQNYLEEDINTLINIYKETVLKDIEEKNLVIKSKEILSLITSILWKDEDYETLKKMNLTLTDILRLVIKIKGLSEVLEGRNKYYKFKLKRQERKILMDLFVEKINKTKLDIVYEEIKKYKGIFKKLFSNIHPFELTKDERTLTVLKNLFNNKFKTFNSNVEKSYKEEEYRKTIDLLSLKPTTLFRNITRLVSVINKKEEQEYLLNALKENVSKVPASTLFIIKKHLKNIEGYNDEKLIINKTGGIFIKNISEKKERTKKELKLIKEIINIIKEGLINFYKNKEEKVFEDYDYVSLDKEELSKIVFPISTRNFTEGLKTLERGSKINVKKDLKGKDVLRIFTYWKQKGKIDVDLDLNAVIISKNKDVYNFIDSISYYNLSSDEYGITHSGDIRNAEEGAAEFIDIKLDKISKTDAKYILVNVNTYTGSITSSELSDFLVGFEYRTNKDAKKDRRRYSIKNVENLFNVNKNNSSFCCFLFDIENQEFIFVNTNLPTEDYSSISNFDLQNKLVSIVNTLNDRINHYPSLYDVLSLVAKAEGKLVKGKELKEIIKKNEELKENDTSDTVEDLKILTIGNSEEKNTISSFRIHETLFSKLF